MKSQRGRASWICRYVQPEQTQTNDMNSKLKLALFVLAAYVAGTAWGRKTPVVSTVAGKLPGASL